MADTRTLLSELTHLTGLFDHYIEEAQKMERRDETFHICDFDYTLFARDEQLEAEQLLRENRGNK